MKKIELKVTVEVPDDYVLDDPSGLLESIGMGYGIEYGVEYGTKYDVEYGTKYGIEYGIKYDVECI